MIHKYFISVRNFINSTEYEYNEDAFPSECGNLIESFSLKENAYFKIEEIIQDYIKSNQGENKYIFTNNFPGKYEHKYGYFVMRYKDSIDKYTIYERKRTVGTFLNTYEDIKHFDISMQKMSTSNNLNVFYNAYDNFDNHDIRKKLLNELVSIIEEEKIEKNKNKEEQEETDTE